MSVLHVCILRFSDKSCHYSDETTLRAKQISFCHSIVGSGGGLGVYGQLSYLEGGFGGAEGGVMNPVDSVIRPPLVVPFSSSKSKPAPSEVGCIDGRILWCLIRSRSRKRTVNIEYLRVVRG